MTGRLLARDEYPRLAGTALAAAMPTLPKETRVIAVEHKGRIVGCLGLVPLWHMEGAWVDPAHRGRGGVVRCLLDAFGREARALGSDTVFPAAADDEMAALLDHMGGVEIPMRLFALNTEARCLSR